MTLEQIENEVEVEKICHRGNGVWPVVKSYLPSIIGKTKLIKEANSATLKILFKNLFIDLYSLRNIRKSKYWVFTNSERRYYIKDASFDRITTGLLNYLDAFLLFENPIPKGRTKNKNLQKGEYNIGMSWIFLLQFIAVKLSKMPKIDHLDVLSSYLKQDLSKIEQRYHRVCAGEKVYSFLMRLFKPKIIFVVCYYSNFELIKAAKKNNIPVVELQHGLVAKTHRAYYYKNKVDDIYLPDFFLSYGSYSSNIIDEGGVVSKNNIFNLGYSFIEAVNKELTISNQLETIIEQYENTVCITGQLEETNTPLIKMICEVCDELPKTCFIFKPRYSNPVPASLKKPNFMSLESINTYELLKYCDCHMTVFSTCAIESLALGTPNISIDINGLYTRYLKEILEENPYNLVAHSAEELKECLLQIDAERTKPELVKQSVASIFSSMAPRKKFLKFLEKVENYS